MKKYLVTKEFSGGFSPLYPIGTVIFAEIKDGYVGFGTNENLPLSSSIGSKAFFEHTTPSTPTLVFRFLKVHNLYLSELFEFVADKDGVPIMGRRLDSGNFEPISSTNERLMLLGVKVTENAVPYQALLSATQEDIDRLLPFCGVERLNSLLAKCGHELRVN